MSREFYEGFETRDYSQWDGVIGAPAIVAGISGMTGYCLSTGPSSYTWRNMPSVHERYFSFKWHPHPTASGSWQTLMHMYNGATRLLSVITSEVIGRSGYYVMIRLADGSTYVGISDLPIRFLRTYAVEIYHKVHSSLGQCIVKIDGVEWCNYTGNTSSGGITTSNKISLVTMSSYDYAYVDDIVTDDAEWIGPARLVMLKTTGAGDLTGWTPSSEPPYGCLNETPISLERFLTASTPQQTLFNIANPGSLGSDVVKGVHLLTMGTLTGSPAASKLRLLVKSNGLLNRGDMIELPGVLNPTIRRMPVNPTTGVAWTELDLVNLQIGLEAETLV